MRACARARAARSRCARGRHAGGVCAASGWAAPCQDEPAGLAAQTASAKVQE